MKKTKLLLGDEAIAQAAINAGIVGVYAYPGTPSTEITEYIQRSPEAREAGIFCKWCTNEKTAMETALGVSYVGRRSIVCMKHVGMNVAADAFVNGAMAGPNGGLVVVVADDPSMHSSQGEQDTRFYSKFAFTPLLEPSSQQEAYDMMEYGFTLSEEYHIPVVMRVTTRMAHSRAAVSYTDKILPRKGLSYPEPSNTWILLPVNARQAYPILLDKYARLEELSHGSGHNRYFDGPDHSMGIVASGIAYNYVRENVGDACPWPILKITQYPLPQKLIRRMAGQCSRILVVEEGQPFIEEQIKGILPTACQVDGRLSGALPRVGELGPDCVRAALGLKPNECAPAARNVVPRPPAFCQGCGHRDLFAALNQEMERFNNHRVFSDVGCYTLGYLPPFKSICSCVDMGSAITLAKGAADAGYYPAIGVIGDSTFAHSGITGLLDVADCNANVVIIISDNEATGMTGGQEAAGTGKIEQICVAVGIDPEHVRVVVPLPKNMEMIRQMIDEEIAYQGPSVIIARRQCMQVAKRHIAKAKDGSN